MKLSLLFLLNFATSCVCWQYFTSMHEWTMENSAPQAQEIHSEYYFGKCLSSFHYVLYTHVHLDHIEVLGKLIIRSWIKVPRIPTCVVLRAMAYPEDLLRSTSYSFQMCVPRITYCHTGQRFKYYFYEWYLPADMIGGMNWDIYFYGPPSLIWH